MLRMGLEIGLVLKIPNDSDDSDVMAVHGLLPFCMVTTTISATLIFVVACKGSALRARQRSCGIHSDNSRRIRRRQAGIDHVWDRLAPYVFHDAIKTGNWGGQGSKCGS